MDSTLRLNLINRNPTENRPNPKTNEAESSKNPEDPQKRDKFDDFLIHSIEEVQSSSIQESIIGDHGENIKSVAISPDDTLVAIVSSTHKTIKVLNLKEKRVECILAGHSEIITSLWFNLDGALLITGSKDKTLRMWNMKLMREVFRYEYEYPINCITVSLHNSNVVCGLDDGSLKGFHIHKRMEVEIGIHGNGSPVIFVLFSPNGFFLVSSYQDMRVILKNMITKEVTHLENIEKEVSCLAFSENSQLLAYSNKDGLITFWNTNIGRVFRALPYHMSPITSIYFSPNSETLGTSHTDGRILLQTITKLSNPSEFFRFSVKANDLKFTKDGKFLLLSSEQKGLLMLSSNEKKESKTLSYPFEFRSVAISSKSTHLASISTDGVLRVWDLLKDNLISEYKTNTCGENALDISPTGDSVAYIEEKLIIVYQRLDQQHPRYFAEHSKPVKCLKFSSDGQKLISGSQDKDVIVRDLINEKHNLMFGGIHSNIVNAVAFSNDSKLAVSGDFDRKVILWDVENETHLHTFTENSSSVQAVVFSNDGLRVASGSRDNFVIVWNVTSKKMLFKFNSHSNSITCIIFSKDCQKIISGSLDASIQVHSLNKDNKRFSLNLHSKSVLALAFTECQKKLITCSSDSTVKINDVSQKQPEFVLQSETIVRVVVFSPSGTFLAVADENGEIFLWSRKIFRVVGSVNKNFAATTALAFSYDGEILASASEDKFVRFWRVSLEGLVEIEKREFNESIRSLAYSPNLNLLATGSTDHIITVFNTENSLPTTQKSILMGHYDLVSSLKFSPCSEYLASGSFDFTVKIWDFNEKILTFTGHSKFIKSISFDPKGKYLISGADDGLIIIWLIREQRAHYYYQTMTNGVGTVSFSTDGNYIGIGCADGKVKIFNFKQMKDEFQLSAHSEKITCGNFSSDGRSYASCSDDGKVLIWELKESDDYHEELLNSNENFIDVSQDNMHIVEKYDNDLVRVKRIINDEVIQTIDQISNFKESVVFSRDGKYLALRFDDRNVIVLDVVKNERFFFKSDFSNCCDFLFSPDKSLLAAKSPGNKKNIIIIWNLHQENPIRTVHNDEAIICFSFSHQSEFLVYALENDIIKIIRTDMNLEISSILNDNKYLYSIQLSSDLKHLSVLSRNHSIKIFEISTNLKVFETFIDFFTVESAVFSNRADFFMIQTKTGFKIYEFLKGKRVELFKILETSVLEFKVKINSVEMRFQLQKPLRLNSSLQAIIDYQKKQGLKITISSKCIDTNDLSYSPRSMSDPYFQDYFTLKETLEYRKKGNSKFSKKHSEILVSQFKYTLLHLASFTGKQAILKETLIKNSEIVIKSDIFGKSPLFYSISRKNQKCIQIMLKYLVGLKDENKELVIFNLNSTRNDFLLIVKNSSKLLPAYLDKIVVDYKIVSVPGSKRLPKFVLSESFVPDPHDFEFQGKSTDIAAVIKQSAYKIPIQPYSHENFLVLETFLNCYNSKIFDNIVVTQIVDYNWKVIYPWAVIYSLVIFLNIFGFLVAEIFGNESNLVLIPFVFTTVLLMFWEIIQLFSNTRSYLTHYLNLIDVMSIISSFYWIESIYAGFSNNYQEFLLAFLLFFRGLTCFRVIQGIRYYINLIVSSVNSIKYFIIIFFYSTLFFATLFHIGASDESLLSDLLSLSWKLNFTGEIELTGDQYLIFTSMFIAMIFNQILMLNMLISILGDSYDQFMIEKNVIDYKEKIDIILEVQTVFTCRRVERSRRKYLHLLVSSSDKKDMNRTDWDGRIIFILKRLENIFERVLHSNNKIGEKIVKTVENSKDKVKLNISELANDMRNFSLTGEKNNKEVNNLLNSIDLRTALIASNADDSITRQTIPPEKNTLEQIETTNYKVSLLETKIETIQEKICTLDEKISQILSHLKITK